MLYTKRMPVFLFFLMTVMVAMTGCGKVSPMSSISTDEPSELVQVSGEPTAVDTRNPASKITIYPAGHLPNFPSGVYTIKCVSNAKYVREFIYREGNPLVADYGNGEELVAQYEVANVGNGKVTLRNIGTGHYVTQAADGQLVAAVGDGQLFDLWAESSAGEISINAVGGKWVSARLDKSDAPLKAVASVSQAWERFTFSWIRDLDHATTHSIGHLPDFLGGIYSIRSVANGKVLGARYADKALVAAYESLAELFEVINLGTGQVALRNIDTGKFVTKAADGQLYATEDQVGPAEKFDLWAESSRGEISINAMGGNWVSARLDESDAPLKAVASASQAWERFRFDRRVMNINPGVYSIRAFGQGWWVGATHTNSDRPLSAAPAYYSNEGGKMRFEITPDGNNHTAFRNVDTGKYVRANLNDGARLDAGSSIEVGSWEEFELFNLGNNRVAIWCVKNSKWVSADYEAHPDGPIYANRDKIGPWEEFELNYEQEIMQVPELETPSNARIEELFTLLLNSLATSDEATTFVAGNEIIQSLRSTLPPELNSIIPDMQADPVQVDPNGLFGNQIKMLAVGPSLNASAMGLLGGELGFGGYIDFTRPSGNVELGGYYGYGGTTLTLAQVMNAVASGDVGDAFGASGGINLSVITHRDGIDAFTADGASAEIELDLGKVAVTIAVYVKEAPFAPGQTFDEFFQNKFVGFGINVQWPIELSKNSDNAEEMQKKSLGLAMGIAYPLLNGGLANIHANRP